MVFLIVLSFYWLSSSSGVSYWDCPEYVITASLLEVGHPPGNPLWSLTMRVATMFFPTQYHAYVINLCSSLFMALAVMLLCRIIYVLTNKVLGKEGSLIASFAGSLTFGFSLSAWFSAIEAEVYSMSVFMTLMVVWVMLEWTREKDSCRRKRLLLLAAYITGLSLGVHQLGLLCLPVCALIYSFSRYPGNYYKAFLSLLLSFAAIGCILAGMMSGAIRLAGLFELFAVNGLHWFYDSGVLIYLLLLFLSFVGFLLSERNKHKFPSSLFSFLVFFLGGFFLFGSVPVFAFIVSAVLSLIVVIFMRKHASLVMWSLMLVLAGYSSIGIILVRGESYPFLNTAAPTDIFSLQSYVGREQYPSKPLLYGETPYSQPMVEEVWNDDDTIPSYPRYLIEKTGPLYKRFAENPHLFYLSGIVDDSDSLENRNVMTKGGDGYLLADYKFHKLTTPELKMWFPRITGKKTADLASYVDWAGMTLDNMEEVYISETVDQDGNPAGRIGGDGKRKQKVSSRPTYLQNLKFFAGYQLGYMYFRYLGWNFVGRQNDVASSGEIDHGNVITGFSPVDNLIYGDVSKSGYHGKAEETGRSVYYGIPFLIGLVGIIILLRSGRNGKEIFAIIFTFFVMTGPALAFYLNMGPMEPRERDYAFLGSFVAYSIYVGVGCGFIASVLRKISDNKVWLMAVGMICSFGLPLFMLIENFSDNDRRGRNEAFTLGSMVLSLNEPAVIFSYGDNTTFPLWYSREVMKKGRQHVLIDYSYMQTPDYILNLTKQNEGRLKLKAKPSDLLYGAFAYTMIPSDTSSYIPSLDELLDDLYSRKDGEPRFGYSKFYLPVSDNDTLTFSLRDFSGGSTFLPFRQLMLLDIIASNPENSLYFLNDTDNMFSKPFVPFMRSGLFGKVLDFHSNENDAGALKKEWENVVMFMPEKSEGRYDYLTSSMIRKFRGGMTVAANSLLDAGDIIQAKEIAEKIIRLYPFDMLSPGNYTMSDSTFHDGWEFRNLLLRLSQVSERDKSYRDKWIPEKEKVDSVLFVQWKTFYDYYRGLTPSQRETMSLPMTNTLAKGIKMGFKNN